MRVRLIRRMDAPGRSGPINGMFALQRALRAARPDWLEIGGTLGDDELPWYWHWRDAMEAADLAAARRPFVCGPNILFHNSRRPCELRRERTICRAASCRLLFTESKWYAQLIDRHRGRFNRAPLVLWPYPIDPKPDGPLEPARHELLIYAKNGRFPGLVEELLSRYRGCRTIRYGRYRRHRLWQLARRSGCCVYLADDDRGPLALAEILLSGCPTIGLLTGAPFVRNGLTGVLLEELTIDTCTEAIRHCQQMNRRRVADLATEQFDTGRIVEIVLRALDKARRDAV